MTEIYKGAIGVTPELARKIIGDDYTTDELEQLNGAANLINEADIESDIGQKIQQNTEAAARAQATAEEADRKAGNAENDASMALSKANDAQTKANQAQLTADANKQSIEQANGALVGKNDTATNQTAGLVKSFVYIEPPELISVEPTLEIVKEKINEIVIYLIQQNRLQEIAGQMDRESDDI